MTTTVSEKLGTFFQSYSHSISEDMHEFLRKYALDISYQYEVGNHELINRFLILCQYDQTVFSISLQPQYYAEYEAVICFNELPKYNFMESLRDCESFDNNPLLFNILTEKMIAVYHDFMQSIPQLGYTPVLDNDSLSLKFFMTNWNMHDFSTLILLLTMLKREAGLICDIANRFVTAS